jgi:hypothetical protein
VVLHDANSKNRIHQRRKIIKDYIINNIQGALPSHLHTFINIILLFSAIIVIEASEGLNRSISSKKIRKH